MIMRKRHGDKLGRDGEGRGARWGDTKDRWRRKLRGREKVGEKDTRNREQDKKKGER
jgi:hypothetical protein